MVAWSKQKLIRVGKRNRQFVLVRCSTCHIRRWVSLDNTRRMKSDRCEKCSKTIGTKPRTGITKTCPRCGKTFYVQPIHSNQIHCSKKCSDKPRKPCEECGKPTKKNHFCSSQCYHKHCKRRRITKICVTCGKEFEVVPSRVKAQTSCCRKYDKQHTAKLCLSCGKKFDVSHHRLNAQYCSRACYKQDGDKNPNYKNGNYSGDKSRPFPYGGSWYSISKAIKERDEHCQWQGCNCRDSLQVHHIVKVQDCDSLEIANSPDNLITYCIRHHQECHRQ